MDACDPGTDTGNIKNFIKVHTGQSPKISREKMCEISKSIKDGRLPLPPLVLTRDKKFLLDSKSPLTQKDYETMFSSSVKSAQMKRIARKTGLSEVNKTIVELKNAVGRRLRSMNVREPIQLQTKRDIVSGNMNSNVSGNSNTKDTNVNGNVNTKNSNVNRTYGVTFDGKTTVMNELQKRRRMNLLKRFGASSKSTPQPFNNRVAPPRPSNNRVAPPRPSNNRAAPPRPSNNRASNNRAAPPRPSRSNNRPNSLKEILSKTNKKTLYERIMGKSSKGKLNPEKLKAYAKTVGYTNVNRLINEYQGGLLTENQVLQKLGKPSDEKIETRLKLILTNEQKRKDYLNAYKSGALNNTQVIKMATDYSEQELKRKDAQVKNKLNQMKKNIERLAASGNTEGVLRTRYAMGLTDVEGLMSQMRSQQRRALLTNNRAQVNNAQQKVLQRLSALEKSTKEEGTEEMKKEVEELKKRLEKVKDPKRQELRELIGNYDAFMENTFDYDEEKAKILLKKEKEEVLGMNGINNNQKKLVTAANTMEAVIKIKEAIAQKTPEVKTNNNENARRKAQAVTNAQKAKEAENAKKTQAVTNAQKAKEAENAQKAQAVTNAQKAQEAENAKKAQAVTNAQKAQEAENAQKAQEAENAQKAKEAENAQKVKEAENAKKAQEAKNLEAAKERLQAKASEANIKFTKNISKLSKLENVQTLEAKMNKAINAKAKKSLTRKTAEVKTNARKVQAVENAQEVKINKVINAKPLALPAPPQIMKNVSVPMNVRNALTTLKLTEVPKTKRELGILYRKFIIKTHPNKGGTGENFQQLKAARKMIDKFLNAKKVEEPKNSKKPLALPAPEPKNSKKAVRNREAEERKKKRTEKIKQKKIETLQKLLENPKINKKTYESKIKNNTQNLNALKQNMLMDIKRQAFVNKVTKKPQRSNNNESAAQEASRLFNVSGGVKELNREKNDKNIDPDVLKMIRKIVPFRMGGKLREKFIIRVRGSQNTRGIIKELEERESMLKKTTNNKVKQMVIDSNVPMNTLRELIEPKPVVRKGGRALEPEKKKQGNTGFVKQEASKFKRAVNGVVAAKRATIEKIPTMNQLQNLGKLKKLQVIQRNGTLTTKQKKEVKRLSTMSQQGKKRSLRGPAGYTSPDTLQKSKTIAKGIVSRRTGFTDNQKKSAISLINKSKTMEELAQKVTEISQRKNLR